MKERGDDFLKRLLSTFKVEAVDHLKAFSSGLLELETAADSEKRIQIVEAVFREAHSLKGAARAVNNPEIERICQSMENVFSALKKQEIVIAPRLLDLLHTAVNALENILSEVESEPRYSGNVEIEALTNQFEAYLKGVDQIPPPHIVSEPMTRKEFPMRRETPGTDTIRVSTSKLDALLLQAEEMVSTKLMLAQRSSDLHELSSELRGWKNEWRKVQNDIRLLYRAVGMGNRQNGPKVDSANVKRLLEFLERSKTLLQSMEEELLVLQKSAVNDQRTVALMVDTLLNDVKKTVMFPFMSLLEMFPRIVRELSRDQGKEVDLFIEGSDIEIDKRVLEEMKDPMIHLVRNCLDHGIESVKERKRKKKPPRGSIRISITQKNGNNVEMTVTDDGKGIDRESVRLAAVKNGILSEEEAKKLSEQEKSLLIFQSGVSTSPMITDVSGRGLGLAIVREKVEKLGGTISFESHIGSGTTFRILLPLTLATFRGLVVRLNERLFILPTVSVERTFTFKKTEIRTIENRETIQVKNELISLVKLANVLELPESGGLESSPGNLYGIVLIAAGKRIAYRVDEILHEQEVLIKTIGPQLSRVRNVAGAAVLGTGEVVPVLNIADLIKSAVRQGGRPAGEVRTVIKDAEKKKSVLVAEDSITARTLLKNILEASGYAVVTAVDGIDAYTQLRAGEFDVVVSDVDMPRMNGFDLTAKIRSDKKLADVPVVLVTALESREDRERGIDVGANAYIVKSSFDQGNLLEVMRRLI